MARLNKMKPARPKRSAAGPPNAAPIATPDQRLADEADHQRRQIEAAHQQRHRHAERKDRKPVEQGAGAAGQLR
jgi:hypothetical protein